MGALAGGAGKYLLGDKKKSGLRNFTEGALGGAAIGGGAGALYGRSQSKDYSPIKGAHDYDNKDKKEDKKEDNKKDPPNERPERGPKGYIRPSGTGY